MALLATIDQYAVVLGLDVSNPANATNTALNTGLVQDLTFASGAVRSFCKRDFEAKQIVEYRDGSGRPDLTLYQYPVEGVQSVNYDPQGYYGDGPNAFGANTLMKPGVDYVLVRDGPDGTSKSGTLRRLGGGGASLSGSMYDPWFWGWGRGSLTAQLPPVWYGGSPGCYRIVYNTGSGVTEELQLATCMLAAYFRRVKKRGGTPISSESLADYSVAFAAQSLNTAPELGSLRQVLTRYRQLSV